MLNKFLDWAQQEDVIRAMILTGSRARNEAVDFLADYDISLFVTDASTYTANNAWLENFGNTWVVVSDTILVNDKQYPTRLVIFEGGIKVDFTFYDIAVLKTLKPDNDLYKRFARGCKVLLDKDGLAKQLTIAPLKKAAPEKPSLQEFETVVNEFFFEVYHVAKYLHRRDLWHAKFRDWAAKEFLLRMIEWNERTRHDWDYNTYYLGVHMQSWINKDTYNDLQQTFGHFDVQDSWQALQATIALFRKLATQTATTLGYSYPNNVDKHITQFVQTLQNK